SRVVVPHCVRLLAEGHLIAFPIGAAYGVAAWALRPEAVARLPQRPGPPDQPVLSLAVRGPADALDWVPAMGSLARRLTRRCGPGPVQLVLAAAPGSGRASRLPEAVRQQVLRGGAVNLCMPAHESVLQTLRLLPGPLVFASVPAGGGTAGTADQVIQELGERV